MPTALITGASAGLGAEFAAQLAARGADLVLVARSNPALTALASRLADEHGVVIEVLVADLTQSRGMNTVAARLADAQHPIDLLVNNAGFGLPLRFADNALADEVDHLRIHVEAPLRLMHAALGVMRGRGGRIINVASVAAFIPRSTYAACKRWTVSMSEWANAQYAADRVSVTALCPGFTHTDFHARMGLATGEEGVPRWMWLNAPDVVRSALRDAARGKSVSVPSLRYRVIVALTRFVPAGVLARAGRRGRF